MDNKEKFLAAAREHIEREGIEDLLEWIVNTDFFAAPASSRYHGAYKGGLADHSLNVYKRLQELSRFFAEDAVVPINPESIAIVGLFHDLCKIGCYKVSTRNVKNGTTGQWEKVPFYKFEEEFPFGGHGSKSVYLVQHFIRLEPWEAAAINSHMGPWDRHDYGSPGQVYEQNMLAWMLHVADEAATYIDKT